jgi:uncharacterized protein (DUF58 family)
MRNYMTKGLLALAFLIMMSAFTATKAQSMTISVNPTTVSAGGTVGVFAFVTNTSSSKSRINVEISSLSPCGITTVIGTNRLDLRAGQTVQVTVSYPVPPDACRGMYEVSIGTRSGGKRSTAAATVSASTSLMVQ